MTLEELIRKLARGGNGTEWTQGEGENWNEGDRRPRKRGRIRLPRFTLLITAAVFLLLLGLSRIVDFYTDLLWYESQGLSSVFWRRIAPQVVIFAVCSVVTAVVYLFNWRLALKIGTNEFRAATGDDGAVLVPSLYVTVCALFLSLLAGFGMLPEWPVVMQFLHRVPFGDSEPIFGRDIGFYVFSLPFLKMLQSWFSSMTLFSLVGSVILYLLCRSLRSEEGNIVLVRRARLHVTSLCAVLSVWIGAGLWLSRYELLYSPSGIVFGMGYTDYNVRLTAVTIFSIAALAAALLLIVTTLVRGVWKASVILIGLLVGAGFFAQTLLPSLVQNYVVKPNEYELERRFLENHIRATRRAFAIDNVKIFQMTPRPEVTPEEMDADSETVQNIRLWDYGPLLRTYKQLQEIRTYYDFGDIDIGKYEIDGRKRQVMLSVRELDQSQLQSKTWVNAHLEFTHGFGVVMNPVNEMEEGGLPVFYMKDLPPKSTVPIRIDRPQIYYGEKPSIYALVKTEVKEFDYPMGDANVRGVYEGKGGVAIGSLFRRLLFALKFRDSEILFTGSLKPESRILYNRNIREAIGRVAPFLILEEDAYPVVCDGRILWLQDAYTASGRYPYSRPLSPAAATQAGLHSYVGVNYIRNSVKITVDAYDGNMTFYIADSKDPIVKNWAAIFPGLFVPQEKTPPYLREHFRYPEEFFEVQSEMYRVYHMTDTNTYYNREDVWMTTPQGQERRIRPNYVTMELMDEKRPEFTLIAPFMPFGRNNLIGWMAGRCDGDHYGELVVYRFPKQELVFGPPQIEALIDQNTTISSQLSLWSQRGSDVIRGDLLVIPIGKSLLYVQPLYMKADRSDLPELKRIILSTGGRVAWGETFDRALAELMGSRTGAKAPRPSESGEKSGSAGPPETPRQPTEASSASLRELAKEARRHYDAAESAARGGKWADYGSELKKLEEVLSRIEALSEK